MNVVKKLIMVLQAIIAMRGTDSGDMDSDAHTTDLGPAPKSTCVPVDVPDIRIDYIDESVQELREAQAKEEETCQKIRNLISKPPGRYWGGEEVEDFIRSFRNTLEYAATGMTAPEIIIARANANKDNMSLKCFKGDNVTRNDAKVAKNYMSKEEMRTMINIETGFLRHMEQSMNKDPTIRPDHWKNELSWFLNRKGWPILYGPGKVKRKDADAWASKQYDRYETYRKTDPNQMMISLLQSNPDDTNRPDT